MGDLTFAEAYQRSGLHINIAVAEGYDLVLRQENVYNFGIKKDKEYNQVLMHPHIDVSVL